MRPVTTILPYADVFKKYKAMVSSKQLYTLPLVRNIFTNSSALAQRMTFLNRHHPPGQK
jgi:hypothetical protein